MDGFAHRDFAAVEEVFHRQLERTDGGAALTIFHRGEPVVDLWGGDMVEALAAEPPAYEPGTQCGYHGLTYGWLIGEIVQRVTGRQLGEVITSDVDAPLGLDGLYLGCPPEQRHRVAALEPMRVFGPRVPKALHQIRRGIGDQFGKALSLTGSPVNTRRLINALFPRGMEDVMASPEVMDASIPAEYARRAEHAQRRGPLLTLGRPRRCPPSAGPAPADGLRSPACLW
jgi:CubicO group peptidase (beta-lactamase class C family)